MWWLSALLAPVVILHRRSYLLTVVTLHGNVCQQPCGWQHAVRQVQAEAGWQRSSCTSFAEFVSAQDGSRAANGLCSSCGGHYLVVDSVSTLGIVSMCIVCRCASVLGSLLHAGVLRVAAGALLLPVGVLDPYSDV